MPISEAVLAYTVNAVHHPLAIEHFLAWTERGVKPPLFIDNREAGLDLADLLVAHTIASRNPSPLLEGLWIDGMDDYPLGRVLIDYLTADHETWLRKRPAFERAYKLHSKANGRLNLGRV